MNKVLEYFNQLNNEELINREITVYGWEFNYQYRLISSVVPYLFEDLKIKEHIAKKTNENRDLRVKEKVYITIHDTGDTAKHHTAKFWSDAVYNEQLKDTLAPYKASFQYVVGNDGIYHNIPDNEVAYHAGDSTAVDYDMFNTFVKISDACKLDIDSEGYYTINGNKTKILAPKFEKGDISKIATINDINDQGISMSMDDEYFYIGPTYFNQTYELIANRGGNNNSIGIETCVNEGTNIYYTLLMVARLVAKLLKENNLEIYDIKQHHFFSGKNCPQTLRMNNLWDHFLYLVEVAVKIQSFIDEGYEIKFKTSLEYVKENGVIDHLPLSVKGIKYTIETTFEGVTEDYSYIKLV